VLSLHNAELRGEAEAELAFAQAIEAMPQLSSLSMQLPRSWPGHLLGAAFAARTTLQKLKFCNQLHRTQLAAMAPRWTALGSLSLFCQEAMQEQFDLRVLLPRLRLMRVQPHTGYVELTDNAELLARRVGSWGLEWFVNLGLLR
jgi:hypothetical protein